MTRITTTHAGSLPRPASLTELHAERYKGEEVDPATLAQLSTDAARQVLAKQLSTGLHLVNNGEVGRESFFTYVQHRMTESRVNLLAPPQATGEVRYIATGAIEDECSELIMLLAEHNLPPSRGFISAPSPGIIATSMENVFYPDMAAYVESLGLALTHEYRAIVNAGFTLQIDAPDLALERHTLFQDKPLSDFRNFVKLVLGVINTALDGLDRERVRLHVCWGNYEGPHDSDVPLAEIWEDLAKANVGGIMLSMANPRHAHEYRLFREAELPDNMQLLAGVIDTTTNYVEHPETVADRIERIAEVIGDPTRVVASTDCGFETSAGVGAVSEEIVWAKLSSLTEGAALASDRLF